MLLDSIRNTFPPCRLKTSLALCEKFVISEIIKTFIFSFIYLFIFEISTFNQIEDLDLKTQFF